MSLTVNRFDSWNELHLTHSMHAIHLCINSTSRGERQAACPLNPPWCKQRKYGASSLTKMVNLLCKTLQNWQWQDGQTSASAGVPNLCFELSPRSSQTLSSWYVSASEIESVSVTPRSRAIHLKREKIYRSTRQSFCLAQERSIVMPGMLSMRRIPSRVSSDDKIVWKWRRCQSETGDRMLSKHSSNIPRTVCIAQDPQSSLASRKVKLTWHSVEFTGFK
jgi:hypothetical protein